MLSPRDLSEEELKDIFNIAKYDNKLIEFIELVGAFVVSKLFNEIFIAAKNACAVNNKNKFSEYENQLEKYMHSMHTKVGLTKEFRDLWTYCNKKLSTYQAFGTFCQRFAAITVPEHRTDILANLDQVIEISSNSFLSILDGFLTDIIQTDITIIVSGRHNADSPRQLQNKFIHMCLLCRHAEHHKYIKKPKNTKTGVNNEIVRQLNTTINKLREENVKLNKEKNKLLELVKNQNILIRNIKEKMARPRQPEITAKFWNTEPEVDQLPKIADSAVESSRLPKIADSVVGSVQLPKIADSVVGSVQLPKISDSAVEFSRPPKIAATEESTPTLSVEVDELIASAPNDDREKWPQETFFDKLNKEPNNDMFDDDSIFYME